MVIDGFFCYLKIGFIKSHICHLCGYLVLRYDFSPTPQFEIICSSVIVTVGYELLIYLVGAFHTDIIMASTSLILITRLSDTAILRILS